MAMKRDVEELFENSIEANDIHAIALTSKNGIPIASKLKEGNEHESFSTLSATILGASEVIFSAFKKEQPDDILIKSNDSILLIREIKSDSVLALMGKLKDKDKLIEVMGNISKEMEDIIENSPKFEVAK